MTSGRNVKCFSSLFLSFFLFYAISPLSYTLAGNGDSTDAGSIVSGGFRLFSWELVFSRLASKENSENGNSAFKVLFRKKRATIPDSPVLKTGPSKDNASIVDSHFTPSPRTLHSSRIAFSSPKCLRGFLFSYSGLSPPFSDLNA